MSTLDIILLVCFVPAIVRGIQHGFISQVVSLVSVILGIWLAFHFSEMACEWLRQYFPNMSETVLNIAGFVLILAVVAILFCAVAFFLLFYHGRRPKWDEMTGLPTSGAEEVINEVPAETSEETPTEDPGTEPPKE